MKKELSKDSGGGLNRCSTHQFFKTRIIGDIV